MAAPEFVPESPTQTKHYASPPQREGGWAAVRPGEVVGAGGDRGDAMGSQGPDQGYAITLTKVFKGKLHLVSSESLADVNSGAVAVAMKRASLFGRAPVVHDLRIAYMVFGFLDPKPDPALVTMRKELFAEVHHSFHYFERRAIADIVPDEVLRQTPDQVASAYSADWRSQLHV